MAVEGKINILDAIPVCAEQVVTKWVGECATLTYPRFKRSWMRKLFLPRGMSPDIRVQLEEQGSAVWRLIDGRRTVGEIVGLLAEFHHEDEQYDARIVTYLMQLRKDGFIQLVVRQGE